MQPNNTQWEEEKLKLKEEFEKKYLYWVVLGSTMNDGSVRRFKETNPDAEEIMDWWLSKISSLLLTTENRVKKEMVEKIEEFIKLNKGINPLPTIEESVARDIINLIKS